MSGKGIIMSRRFLFFAGVFCFLSVYTGNVSADSLVAHWKFDESYGTTAADSSGYDNPGTLYNWDGGDTSWIGGKIGNALIFDGNDSYVRVDDDPALNFGTGSFTLSLWIKTDNFGTRRILQKGTSADPGGCRYTIPYQQYKVYFDIDDGVTKTNITSTSDWHGPWVHVAAVRNRATDRIYLYRNGQEDCSTTDNTNGSIDKAVPLMIGLDELGSAAECFKGIMDDIRFYDFALTQPQIESIYNLEDESISNPDPQDEETGVSVTKDLSWDAGWIESKYDVYFGTDETAVTDANTTNDPQNVYKARITSTTYDPCTLSPTTQYYWRIDSLDGSNNVLFKGPVWEFTTASLKASSPSPMDEAVFQPQDLSLSWVAGAAAVSHNVYFGIDEDDVNTAGRLFADINGDGPVSYPDIAVIAEQWLTEPGGADPSADLDGNGDVNFVDYALFANDWLEPPDAEFKGNQPGEDTTYDLPTLSGETTYYWRIDEINVAGTTTGTVWSFTTIVAAPGQASSPTPADSATDVAVDTDLSWSAGSGATSHDVYFGQSSPGTFQGNQAGTTYDTGTMNNSTTYYWRIDEVNAGGTTTGVVWSFTTIVAAPGQASSPSPADSATDVGVTTDLSWSAGSGATSHDVYFGQSSPGTFQGNQAGTTFDTGTMTEDTTYYWRIDEVNVIGTTTGVVWSFTTTTGTPGQASNPYPMNGITDVPVNTDLMWTAGSGATSHDVYFGQSSPGAFQGNQAGTTFDTGTMNNDTTYYWRIDEVNAGGTTTGTVWSFTTIITVPGQASSPSPANAATDVAVNTDLSWTAGSGASTHDVYFGASSPGTFQGNQAGTTFDTGTMAEDTTYYWRIDEVNAGGTTTGTVWSFTTLTTPVVISNLDPSAYNVVYDALAAGQLLYVDRTVEYVTVPAAYQGETFIQTANDDKQSTGSSFMSFSINQDCSVYVAHDDRLTTKPSWLTSNFTDTGDDLVDNDAESVHLSLYKKDFSAGTVTLGGNEGGGQPNCSMYTVVVIPLTVSPPGQASSPTPADSATEVAVDTDLSWTAGAGATSHDVYFGQTSPGTFQGNQASITFDPGTMNEYTTYYWRIDEINSYGTNTGTVWSFTTDSSTSSDMYSDTWVAVDALGRALPDNSICGDPRSGVTTAIFYFLWLGEHNTGGPYDNTQLLAEDPYDPAWGPEGEHHHWGQSELGYYLSDDEYVMRKHAHMLADAGVDVIFFDVTNGWTYESNYKALCSVFMDIRAEGGTTPQIAFLANAYADNVVANIYNDLYSQNLYPDLWFYWKGKPLILAPLNGMVILDRTITYSQEIQNFFNMRYSWAWNAGYNLWTWIDYYPQDYGWHESSSIPEELSVAMGHWPHENIGRSYSNGSQPAHNIYGLTGTEDQGINFTEQLSRLDTIDPELLFITGWNEWVAGRHVFTGSGDPVTHFIGDPLQPGDSWFVDNYNQEYSRDAEPMKDGHTDNYYYQMIDGIRRYKGVRELPTPSAATTISIDGSFSDWVSVGPKYRDWKNDTTHRNHDGWGSAGPYINTTGRNDFITAKVARDNTYIYFYIETNANITSYTDNNWMMLFINADQNYANGWEGYDYVVNMAVNSATSTTLKGTSGGWNWTNVNTNVAYQVSGNKMEIRVARSDIGQGTGSDPIAFDFHWADNIQSNDDIIEFAVSGDSAPGRRFNYRYEGAGVATPGQASNPSPADSATGVSVDADLSWTAGSGATSHDVYFGETSPGSYQGNQAGTTFDPGTMTENATYYWRIDGVNANGTTTGTVWSFTTETTGSASFVLWQLPSQTDLQMNSYVIKTINDEIIVIDGGYAEDADYLKGFLSTLGNQVDMWFISHQHDDHIGALTTILGNPGGLTINNIYGSMHTEAWVQTNEPESLQPVVDLNAALSAAGKTVTELTLGQLIQLDNVSIKIIGVKNPEITTRALNNSSVAMKVWDCQNSVLFLGDLGPEGGQKILDGPYLADLDSDYVQMAHHGQNGVTEAFYTVVAPTYCLWPTPLWLWNNDDGGGYDSGPWLTLIVRAWMVNLGVQENYCMFDGLISINMNCSASPGQASSPTPADNATDVAVNTDLSWTAGSDATSHDVYFGQDSTPDAGEFQGNQAGTTFDTGTMANDTTYYWRIDEVNAYGTTTGAVWSLTTVGGGSWPLVISNLDPSSYNVVYDSLAAGQLLYVDRSIQYVTVPSAYQGETFIQTENDDKHSTGSSFMSFSINQDCSVYVAHDDRLTTKPSWLTSNFTDTGDDLVDNDAESVHLSLYKKDFSAGTVTLGGNEGGGQPNCSMYTVVVIEQ